MMRGECDGREKLLHIGQAAFSYHLSHQIIGQTVRVLIFIMAQCLGNGIHGNLWIGENVQLLMDDVLDMLREFAVGLSMEGTSLHGFVTTVHFAFPNYVE